MTAATHTLDLGVADVHIPSAIKREPSMSVHTGTMASFVEAAAGDENARDMIDAATRNGLAKNQFADPANRKYPVDSKARADNAAARLEQQRGSMSPAKYRAIKSRVTAAQRRFGEGKKAKPAKDAPPAPTMKRRGAMQRPGLRVTVDHPVHGRFEIRQMRGGGTQYRAAESADSTNLLLQQLPDGVVRMFATFPGDFGDVPTAEEAPTKYVWCNIAIRGHFEGHGAGPFDLNDKIFNEIIRNYSAVDLKHVAFDFEHASEADGAQVAKDGAPAQAWIHDLRISDRGLDALVEYKEPARTYVKEGKYKFVSPAIRFGAKDPRTGKPIGARLTSVAFTNQPFLRGLDALTAKDTTKMTTQTNENVTIVPMGARFGNSMAHSPNEYMPKLKAAFGAHDLTTTATSSSPTCSARPAEPSQPAASRNFTPGVVANQCQFGLGSNHTGCKVAETGGYLSLFLNTSFC